LKKGGTLTIVRAEVELMVTAGNIPDHIEADLGELEIGETINISDITLPEGTRPVISDRDFVIANIAAPGGAADDEDEDAAEETAEDADAAEGDAPEADAET
jgi:large subunit ribosomal protein L25